MQHFYYLMKTSLSLYICYTKITTSVWGCWESFRDPITVESLLKDTPNKGHLYKERALWSLQGPWQYNFTS